MREGKYVEEVYRRVCAMQSDGTNVLADVLRIANDVAREHPLQYERFRIWSGFVRGWRWVTGKTCSGISERSSDRGA